MATNKERRRKLISFGDTDAGNAEAFALLHGDRFRYNHTEGKWLVWNGRYWGVDKDGEAERAALSTARARQSAALLVEDRGQKDDRIRWALQSEGVYRCEAMLKSARSIQALSTTSDLYDRDPYMLTVGNGTLDLRAGDLRKAHPKGLITRGTNVPYDPKAECPRWLQFLKEVFAGDDELIAYIQRAVGYSLTGDTREQCLFILLGSGANGKTTFLEILLKLLGDHAVTTAFSTFAVQFNPGNPRNDVAALCGARLVKASEGEHRSAFAEALIKEITGGGKITARFLYHEQFSYKPQFKIWIETNYKPTIRETSTAIWRRIRLIPFSRQFQGDRQDRKLPEKLEAELPGILAWAVQGCFAWQKRELGEPRSVQVATREYRQESDELGRFLRERCFQGARLSGRWTATFADSIISGIVEMNLVEQPDGKVSGTYAASTGGGGRVEGFLQGDVFTFTVVQTSSNCPGTFTGTLGLSGDVGSGQYGGRDCLGERKNGVVTLTRIQQTNLLAAEVKRDEEGNILPLGHFFAQGTAYVASSNGNYLLFASASETRGYFTVCVAVQNNAAQAVTFEPSRVAVRDLLTGRTLRYFSPQEVTNRIMRRATYRAMLAGFFMTVGSAMGQSAGRTYYTSGNFAAFDRYGNFMYGTVSGTTTMYQPSNPARIQVQQRAVTDPILSAAAQRAAQIETTAAYTHTLLPNTYILGYLYFSKPKKGDLQYIVGERRKDFFVRMVVPVGNEKFGFVFPFEVLQSMAKKKQQPKPDH